MSAPRRTHSGQAYVVGPRPDNHGPGVLVLHAWWGLTPFFRDVCDRLASEGFVALAPDLYGGRTADTPDDAQELLAEADAEQTAQLVLDSARTLAGLDITPEGPVGVLGFSMGGSLALLLATRVPELVSAATVFYGTQNIDFSELAAPVQGHFAEHDELVSDDELAEMEARLRLEDIDLELHHYAGTGHWFFEADRSAAHDPAAAEEAWDRTITFLRHHLGGSPEHPTDAD